MMESYAMGTMRNLPDAHPVNKLLLPHFRYTMAINTRARATLINKGGIIDQIFAIGGEGKEELFRRVSAVYNINWTNIKRSVKDRGVDDPDLLPGYFYRDDGLKIWKAVEEFVSNVINAFYSCDDDVENDAELQNWTTDIYENAFPDCNTSRGLPEKIITIKDLIEYCTLIMFTGSAQHASINFGQYFIYGYIPNAPFSLHQPPPTEKGKADYQTLLDTLPHKMESVKAMALTYILSRYSKDEVRSLFCP